MTETIYHIGNMDCANCAKEVETGVGKLAGVQAVRVDFASSKMTLTGDVPFDVLQKRVEMLGKTIQSPDVANDGIISSTETQRGGVMGFGQYLLSRRDTQLAVMGGVGVLVTLLLALLGLPENIAGVMYSIAMLVTLYPIAKNGLTTLWVNRNFNINLLMTIAALGAIVIGEYLESATVIFLFAVGEALEGYTADRARAGIRSLMALKPARALRVVGGMGQMIPLAKDVSTQDVPIEALAIDDVIMVKPGERIPMDGVIVQGMSGVNEAPITGESMPVPKDEGDEVYAGTVNGEGLLYVQVTRLAADNTLSRIIKLVEDAQASRAPIQRFIDQFAHYYTPAVAITALLIAIMPPLLFNAPFYDTATEHGWLYRALSMLVIACPCALVISTPVTIISGITAGARRGVLIKGGVHLEALGTIKTVAFDKTGTLTRGQPVVTAWRSVDCATGESCPTCDDILALASAVEQQTVHPLAQAVVNAAQSHHLAAQYPPAQRVEMLAGHGVRGQVNEQMVTIGSHSYFDAQYPHADALCGQIKAAEARGQTAMLVHDGDNVRGYITVRDQIRETSRDVIAELNALGLQTVMLTGDNATVAQAVAADIGVQDVRAGLLPQDKVDAVRDLLQTGQTVAMVGDGVNDTPALALATVGIAMGGAGSTQALETADVVLMQDDITQLPATIRLSRFVRHLIRQNVAFSFGIKFLFLVLAFFGLTSLWVAVLADVGTSLLVTLNGMRPLRDTANLEA